MVRTTAYPVEAWLMTRGATIYRRNFTLQMYLELG